jgi:hypothetical protein
MLAESRDQVVSDFLLPVLSVLTAEHRTQHTKRGQAPAGQARRCACGSRYRWSQHPRPDAQSGAVPLIVDILAGFMTADSRALIANQSLSGNREGNGGVTGHGEGRCVTARHPAIDEGALRVHL